MTKHVHARAVAVVCKLVWSTALGVERLWSACRLALSDRRRSLSSGRLMLLMFCKMNMHLLSDDAELRNLGVSKLVTSQGFVDLFEDLVQLEEAEMVQAMRAAVAYEEAAVPAGAGEMPDAPVEAAPAAINWGASSDEENNAV